MSKLARAARAAIALAGAALSAIALADQPAAPGEVERQRMIGRAIRANCSASWPGNEARLKQCIHEQLDAGQRFKSLAERFPAGSEARAPVARCLQRWVRPEVRSVDFRMALQCLEFELETLQSHR
jgi:hypothetical protein